MNKIVRLVIPNIRGHIYKPMTKNVNISNLRYCPEVKAKDNTLSGIFKFFDLDIAKMSDKQINLAKELEQAFSSRKQGSKLNFSG